jgi:hypothetical protein
MFKIIGGRDWAAVVGAGVVVVMVTCAARARRLRISSSDIPDTPCRSSHLERKTMSHIKDQMYILKIKITCTLLVFSWLFFFLFLVVVFWVVVVVFICLFILICFLLDLTINIEVVKYLVVRGILPKRLEAFRTIKMVATLLLVLTLHRKFGTPLSLIQKATYTFNMYELMICARQFFPHT